MNDHLVFCEHKIVRKSNSFLFFSTFFGCPSSGWCGSWCAPLTHFYNLHTWWRYATAQRHNFGAKATQFCLGCAHLNVESLLRPGIGEKYSTAIPSSRDSQCATHWIQSQRTLVFNRASAFLVRAASHVGLRSTSKHLWNPCMPIDAHCVSPPVLLLLQITHSVCAHPLRKSALISYDPYSVYCSL